MYLKAKYCWRNPMQVTKLTIQKKFDENLLWHRRHILSWGNTPTPMLQCRIRNWRCKVCGCISLLAKILFGKIDYFRQNWLDLDKNDAKFGQIWLDLGKIDVKFGQNQNLASLKIRSLMGRVFYSKVGKCTFY